LTSNINDLGDIKSTSSKPGLASNRYDNAVFHLKDEHKDEHKDACDKKFAPSTLEDATNRSARFEVDHNVFWEQRRAQLRVEIQLDKLFKSGLQNEEQLTAIQKALSTLLTQDQVNSILSDLAAKLELNQNRVEDLQTSLQESNRARADLLHRYNMLKTYLKYGSIFISGLGTAYGFYYVYQLRTGITENLSLSSSSDNNGNANNANMANTTNNGNYNNPNFGNSSSTSLQETTLTSSGLKEEVKVIF
jgi:hypothetical protein